MEEVLQIPEKNKPPNDQIGIKKGNRNKESNLKGTK